VNARRSSRAILMNADNRVFLFKFEFAMLSDHRTLWVAPGGRVEEGESDEKALSRELHEEMGLEIEEDYKCIFYRNKPFITKTGEEFISEERFYLVKINQFDLSMENMTQNERKLTKDWKWWSADEIHNSSETFFVDDLDVYIAGIINGDIPEEPAEI
jgi:8-oxo-dGTP diphosphatase